MLLKESAEPVCSLIPSCVAGCNRKLQHQILTSFGKRRPFAVLKLFRVRECEPEAPPWESERCRVSQGPGVSWLAIFIFYWIIRPPSPPPKVMASHENTALASCGRSRWETRAVEGHQVLLLGWGEAVLSGRDALSSTECYFSKCLCPPSDLPALPCHLLV